MSDTPLDLDGEPGMTSLHFSGVSQATHASVLEELTVLWQAMDELSAVVREDHVSSYCRERLKEAHRLCVVRLGPQPGDPVTMDGVIDEGGRVRINCRTLSAFSFRATSGAEHTVSDGGISVKPTRVNARAVRD